MKFQIVCLKNSDQIYISEEVELCHSLLAHNALWEKADFERNSNNIILDRGKNIKVQVSKSEFPKDDKDIAAKESDYFTITVDGAYAVLEPFRIQLLKCLKDSLHFNSIYLLADEISHEIAIKIYPYINKVENALRSYLLTFFVLKLGAKWWDITADENMKKKVNDRKNNEKHFKDYINNSVFLIDFSDLGNIVYTKSTGYNTKESIIDMINSINTEEELEKLKSDLKTNSDKFFKEVFKDKDFQKKWEELSAIRNLVAHNNLFIGKDKDTAIALSKELLKIISEAKEEIQRIEISGEESNAIRESIISTFAEYDIITEEKLLEELKISQSIAAKYSGYYVGLKNFVTNILAKKNFSISHSYAVINKLYTDGKIELYTVSDIMGNDVKAIRIPADSNIFQ